MNENIISMFFAVLVIAMVLYVGWFLAEAQTSQIGEVMTRGCNETTLETGCYTNDANNYMVYCKNTFNSTLNSNVSTCVRVTVI